MREFLSADDKYFLAYTVYDVQHIMDLFTASYRAFGLKISLTKTKVMFTFVTGELHIKPLIAGHNIYSSVVVETFTYLESTLAINGSLDA